MTHVQRMARASALAAFLGASLISLPTYASSLAEETSPPTAAVELATPGSIPPPTVGGLSTSEPTGDGPPPAATLAASDTPEPNLTATDRATSASSETAFVPTATVSTEVTESTAATESTTTTSLPSLDSTATETPTPTLTLTQELPLPTDEVSASPTVSPTETPLSTATLTPSFSPTPSLSPTPTVIAPRAETFPAGSVLINEVAWAGTEASSSDEWIELWNPGPDSILLDGWHLADGGDIDRSLSGVIAGYGFFLMERTDDKTVADVNADQIYTGSLANGGEALTLFDPAGNLIDTANASGGPWPAGSTSPRASMERHSALDLPMNWATFAGAPFAHDADGGSILGTPRQPNSPTLPTATATSSPTPTLTPTQTGGTSFPPGALRINEVAWAGTSASANDEWIELHNPGTESIPLEGWRLSDGGDLNVALSGTIAAGGYFLLERTDDSTVADIGADQVYSGGLSNSGEALVLMDPTGGEIDAANRDGGAWPAGSASTHASMERAAGGGWRSFTGFYGVGRDAGGNAIQGTPRAPNSGLFPTPAPTWIPGRVVINEVLMRPRHDWEGAGGVTTDDEFIELYNRGPGTVNLRGWTLDDTVVGGSKGYALPPITLEAGEFVALFRSRTHVALNDGGDQVRLSAPDGHPVDKVRYLGPSAVNLSYGRLPDGDDVLVYGLWPTPGEANLPFLPTSSFAPGAVLINEIAWAGTQASSSDEWIELYNPGAASILFEGWRLSGGGDLQIDLFGEIPAGSYFLLERTDDSTISDVAADLVYAGGLSNAGEPLLLTDPTGAEIDAANRDGGPWPAGSASGYASMERSTDDDWTTFLASQGVGHDAEGNPIAGTPHAANSVVLPEAQDETGFPRETWFQPPATFARPMRRY